MTSSAKKVTTTTKTVNNNTGVTKSVSVSKSGGSTTVTRTTTIGKAKPVTSSSKSTSTPAKAAAAVLADTRWITGPNDTRDLCGPVAVANALLAATGIEASSAEIERLYRAAGGIGDTGVPVPHLLTEAAASGLAGCRVHWRPVDCLRCADLALMELAAGLGVHAAAVTPEGAAVMWGAETLPGDLDAVIFGAWSLTWH